MCAYMYVGIIHIHQQSCTQFQLSKYMSSQEHVWQYIYPSEVQVDLPGSIKW